MQKSLPSDTRDVFYVFVADGEERKGRNVLERRYVTTSVAVGQVSEIAVGKERESAFARWNFYSASPSLSSPSVIWRH